MSESLFEQNERMLLAEGSRPTLKVRRTGESVVIGGPAYNWQVDCRHAAMMAEVWRMLWQSARLYPLAFHYQHTASLPVGRSGILQRGLDLKADWLIQVDSDVWTDPLRFVTWLELLQLEQTEDMALAGALVPQRSGLVNCWTEAGQRMLKEDLPRWPKMRSVFAVGSAIWAHRLSWYRQHPQAVRAFQVGPVGEKGWVTEDYSHCHAVQQLGGRIVVGDLGTSHGVRS